VATRIAAIQTPKAAAAGGGWCRLAALLAFPLLSARSSLSPVLVLVKMLLKHFVPIIIVRNVRLYQVQKTKSYMMRAQLLWNGLVLMLKSTIALLQTLR
jgi:hypothetical protein